MQFTGLAEKFKSHAVAAAKVAPSNAALPSLNGMLLKTSAGGLECVVTNLETTLKLQIPGKIEQEGQVCVAARLFSEVCHNLPGDQVSLGLDNNILSVNSGNFSSKIPTLPADDFPVIADPVTQQIVSLSGVVARGMLERVVFAAAQSEIQPEISSVLLRSSGGGFVTVATDRYRLAELRVGDVVIPEEWGDVIIPYRIALEASRWVGEGGDVELGFGEQQIWWQTPDAKLIGRVVDGQYPDYERILSNDVAMVITVDRASLAAAVKAVGVFVRLKGNVQLKFDNGKLDISTVGADSGESLVSLDAEGTGSCTILFGLRYLVDGLNAIQEEKLVIRISSETLPVVFSGSGAENYRYVVMPVRV